MKTSSGPWSGRRSLFGDLNQSEIAQGHPGEQNAASLYHNIEHTLRVERTAYEVVNRHLAKHPHLTFATRSAARFVAQVALLHDWDPIRKPGTPARVDATIEALCDDWRGKKPLITEAPPQGLLRGRLRWSGVQFRTALALIQRTEFPFDDAVFERYLKRLEHIGHHAYRAFAIVIGAVLSELSDKTSFYANASFRSDMAAVKGLVNEINAVSGGKAGMTVEKLNTPAFLENIGDDSTYKYDIEAALHFCYTDVVKEFPEPQELLTPNEQARLNGHILGHRAYLSARKQGSSQNAAVEKARAAAARWLGIYRQARRG